MIYRDSDNRVLMSGKVTPAGGSRTVWAGNSIIPIMSGREQKLTVSSTSNNDAVGGTGATSVQIVGLTETLSPMETRSDLNGQTPVIIAEGFGFINSISVTDAGNSLKNEGVIHIGTGTVTGGVPATSYDQIAIEDSIASTIRYTVPEKHSLYINKIVLSRDTNHIFKVKVVTFRNGLWSVLDMFSYVEIDRPQTYDIPLRIPSGTTFALEVISSSSGDVYCKVYAEER